MRQYVAYAKLITSTNRRRLDGTPLDGWHGVKSVRSGSRQSKDPESQIRSGVYIYNFICIHHTCRTVRFRIVNMIYFRTFPYYCLFLILSNSVNYVKIINLC